MGDPDSGPALTPPKVERDWPMTVAGVWLSPFGIVSAGFNAVTEWLERRFLGRRPGADNTASTFEVMNGEVTTLIGVFAGGLGGVIFTRVIDPGTGDATWLSIVWLAMIVALMIATIRLFGWMRREVRAARVGAWEPGVAPDVAIKSLRSELEREAVRTIWPGTAACALKGESGFWRLTRADKWAVIWRTFFSCALVVAWGIIFSEGWIAACLSLAVAVVSFAGVALSLRREYARVNYRTRMVEARFRTLRRRLAKPQEISLDQRVAHIQEAVDSVLVGQLHLQQTLDELLEREGAVSSLRQRPEGLSVGRGWLCHIWRNLQATVVRFEPSVAAERNGQDR